MGTVFPDIDAGLRRWIEAQPMFFVATAPSGDDGHVNLSPKGAMQTFAVLGSREVAYVDYFGSGIETVAHLKQNGRIAIMFCAFEGPPKVLRLHGHGTVLEQHEDGFAALFERFELPEETLSSVRSVIHVDVTRVADSCGFVVPHMAYQGERRHLYSYAATQIRKQGESAIRDYCDVNNARSIDGLEALTPFADGVDEGRRAKLAHEGRKL